MLISKDRQFKTVCLSADEVNEIDLETNQVSRKQHRALILLFVFW